MFKEIITSGLVIATVLLAVAYTATRQIIGLDALIIILNGAFIGAGVSFIIAFYDLLVDAVMGHGPYDRVRQMAISMVIIWAACACFIIASLTVRIQGGYTNLIEWSAVGRYLALVGGVAQVTSPDVGQPLFYGRDRKLLLFAVIVGILVAIALTVLQT